MPNSLHIERTVDTIRDNLKLVKCRHVLRPGLPPGNAINRTRSGADELIGHRSASLELGIVPARRARLSQSQAQHAVHRFALSISAPPSDGHNAANPAGFVWGARSGSGSMHAEGLSVRMTDSEAWA